MYKNEIISLGSSPCSIFHNSLQDIHIMIIKWTSILYTSRRLLTIKGKSNTLVVSKI